MLARESFRAQTDFPPGVAPAYSDSSFLSPSKIHVYGRGTHFIRCFPPRQQQVFHELTLFLAALLQVFSCSLPLL